MAKLKKELIERLTFCLPRLLDALEEPDTMSSGYMIARDKKNSFQVQLVIHKDEDEFMSAGYGEFVLDGNKPKKEKKNDKKSK